MDGVYVQQVLTRKYGTGTYFCNEQSINQINNQLINQYTVESSNEQETKNVRGAYLILTCNILSEGMGEYWEYLQEDYYPVL